MKASLLTILILCLLTVVGVIAFLLTRRDRFRSLYFMVLCAGNGLYILGYILEALSVSRESALISLTVQNAGIPLIAPFFLLFVTNICQSKAVRPWMLSAALLYAALAFLCVLSNNSHKMYYSSVEFLQTGDIRYTVLGHGPLYLTQQVVQTACVALAYLQLFSGLLKWPRESRRQLRYILYGSLPAAVIYFLYVNRVLSPYPDPTPVALTASILLFMIRIAKYSPFDAADAAVQSMTNAVIVVDAEWGYRLSNTAAQRLFPALAGLNGFEQVSGITGWPVALNGIGEAGPIDFSLDGQEGRARHYHAQVSPIGDSAAPAGWTVVITEDSETVETLNRLNLLATTDYLTGLYNRKYFVEAVQRDLELAKRESIVSALAIFDLDHFKDVNDTYGHQAGDTVLRVLADTVRRELRPYDIFARYGGEEFVLYIMRISIQDAEKFAWRLCRVVEEMHIPYQGATIRVTASFGLVEVRGCHSLDDAVAAADEALYKAKAEGRNRVAVCRIPETAGIGVPNIANG